jgi:hypothetical protein
MRSVLETRAMHDDLEYVRANPDHAVRLGSGERIAPGGPLPLDSGMYLVAGKARRGGLRPIASLPAGRTFLSSDRRWLGILDAADPTALSLHNTTRSGQRGFCFEVPQGHRGLALHPSGEMVACRHGDELQVLLPDCRLLLAASYPVPTDGWYDEAFLFSPCGDYLWFAHTPRTRVATLLLLRFPTLEVLDRCPPAHDPGNPYDGEKTWCEVTATASPATNHLALSRQIGDDFLTLDFYSVRRNRIHRHRAHVWATGGDIAGERAGGAYFAADGKRFLVHDSDDWLNEFSFPTCEALARTAGSFVVHDHDAEIGTFGYSGKHVLIEVQGQLRVLRSGDLVPSLRSLGPVREVLESGLVLTEGEGGLQLQTFHLEPGTLSVVADLDSARNEAIKIHHRRAGDWNDVTVEICWVELNLGLADW